MIVCVGALWLYTTASAASRDRENFRKRVRGERVDTAARIDALYNQLSQDHRDRILSEEDFLREERFYLG
jgi:hypothetical protein